ncbi:hypothetical protein WICPIJ_004318 [Wickerhamomyces pijperi]|uniref:DUF8032 domain-containing protein n=1 Tax=Wickerhamomyces pijperi TaxID=599730 RepID=A0A9P8Q7Z6_WICPI|nr:hypothetical protein WICPIJ_004318 [Wickerhamomyces pijperi]
MDSGMKENNTIYTNGHPLNPFNERYNEEYQPGFNQYQPPHSHHQLAPQGAELGPSSSQYFNGIGMQYAPDEPAYQVPYSAQAQLESSFQPNPHYNNQDEQYFHNNDSNNISHSSIQSMPNTNQPQYYPMFPSQQVPLPYTNYNVHSQSPFLSQTQPPPQTQLLLLQQQQQHQQPIYQASNYLPPPIGTFTNNQASSYTVASSNEIGQRLGLPPLPSAVREGAEEEEAGYNHHPSMHSRSYSRDSQFLQQSQPVRPERPILQYSVSAPLQAPLPMMVTTNQIHAKEESIHQQQQLQPHEDPARFNDRGMFQPAEYSTYPDVNGLEQRQILGYHRNNLYYTPPMSSVPHQKLRLPPTIVGKDSEELSFKKTLPGPMRATEPILKKDPQTNDDLLTFKYTDNKIVKEFTVRLPSTTSASETIQETLAKIPLSDAFKKANSLYPNAMVSESSYQGRRFKYETECNEIGWMICWFNEQIRGRKGILQRAVDSWRNTRSDDSLKSRRVRGVKMKTVLAESGSSGNV